MPPVTHCSTAAMGRHATLRPGHAGDAQGDGHSSQPADGGQSIWFGDAAAGNYDLAVGAIVSTLLNSSDYFNAWYRTDGPQNYSFWHNAEFDKLVDQIDV